MADKSLMEEMLTMKISNWESIEYSEGLNCPNALIGNLLISWRNSYEQNRFTFIITLPDA